MFPIFFDDFYQRDIGFGVRTDKPGLVFLFILQGYFYGIGTFYDMVVGQNVSFMVNDESRSGSVSRQGWRSKRSSLKWRGELSAVSLCRLKFCFGCYEDDSRVLLLGNLYDQIGSYRVSFGAQCKCGIRREKT